jgi:hypothetical protein
MVVICAQFAEIAKVTYKLNVDTTSMRSASQNGWKRMQSVPTAIRLSPINLNITAIVAVRNRETLISPNPPK